MQLFNTREYAPALISAYRRFPAKDSTLDLDFVNNRGVIAGVVGGALDRAAVTRATTSTYFDAYGNIQTAAINAPVLDGFDITTGRKLGLASWATRSNILLNSLLNKTPLSTQSVTVTAQSYALSFYGPGSITLSGTASATLTGTSDTVKSVLVFTPTAGTLTLTVSGSVFWAQLEAGINSTSFIPTDGTSKSRSADVIVMTGTAFSDWYSQSGGTLICKYYLPHTVANSRALGISDNTGSNAIELAWLPNAGQLGYMRVTAGGTLQFASVSGTVLENEYKTAGQFSSAGASVATNGRLWTTQTAYSQPVVDRMYIGSGTTGVSQLNGYLERITFIPKLLQTLVISGVSR